MQSYPYRVAENKTAMLQNNNTNGAKPIALFKKENGITFSRNGAEFVEVTLITTDKSGRENSRDMFLADLPGPDGSRHYDLMSLSNWLVYAHCADALVAFKTSIKDAKNAQNEKRVTSCKEAAETLKLALSPVEAKAVLKSRGFTAEEIASVEAVFKS